MRILLSRVNPSAMATQISSTCQSRVFPSSTRSCIDSGRYEGYSETKDLYEKYLQIMNDFAKLTEQVNQYSVNVYPGRQRLLLA